MFMNIADLHDQYLQLLKTNKDEIRAEKEKAYLYSDLKHYGIPTSKKRAFLKQFNKDLLNLKKSEALEWVEYFWGKPSHEERSLALHILNLHKESLDISDINLIEKIMKESRGWAFLDSLIIPIMPIILEKDKKAYEYLIKWIKDSDFWVRRSALLAQVMFFRKGEGGDKKLFFKLAKSQFDEAWINEVYKDSLQRKRARFFIRKAIGWSLREMSGKDPDFAFKFLKKYKKEMSGLSFRDGSRKLPGELQRDLEY